MEAIKRFWQLLKIYKAELRLIYLYAVLIGFINLTLPLGVQAIINFLQAGEFTITWLVLVALVLIGILVSSWLQIMQLHVLEKSQQNIFARSAFEFAYRLPLIKILELDKSHTPELANRFFDTLTIQKGVPKIMIDFSLAIFQIVFGVVLLSIYSSYFIIVGIILIIFSWIIIKYTSPYGLKTSIKESKFKYHLVHWLEEIARTHKTFKIYNQTKLHLAKTDDIVSEYIQARENHFNVLLGHYRLVIIFKLIVGSALLLLGGSLVFIGEMNIGQFVAAEIIVLLIINSVEKLFTTIDVVYDVLTALDKIGHVTDLELDQDSGKTTLETNEGLSLLAQSIALNIENNTVFTDLSFQIESNDTVLLQGQTGSGKSLLLQVLAGIHSINKGKLYINNITIEQYQKKSLYQNIAIGLNTVQLFEGSIYENITLGREINTSALSEILNELGLNKQFQQLSLQLDSIIDANGRRLPQNTIQKIQLARLLVGNPKLLLLEDPLLYIDKDEKKRIIDYLTNKNRNWTLIVISDEEYWIGKCNKTIQMTANTII
jgi:ABC-type bacteriocin/lantibiotic exporter with double-glycine peptidase domain